MAMTKDIDLPSYEDLKVPQEITLSTTYFKAVAPYMHYKCEEQIKEFMLKRKELEDPRKTIAEGKAVTACGVDFLRSLKKGCTAETDSLANCIDKSSAELYISYCRQEQLVLDNCVEEKTGIKRPRRGYFSKLHIHNPTTEAPRIHERDYKADAALVLKETPADAPEYSNKNFKNFKEWRNDFLRG